MMMIVVIAVETEGSADSSDSEVMVVI